MTDWKYIKHELPKKPEGKRFLVACGEFGQTPGVAVALMWQSSLSGQSPQWYLDPDLYGLERHYYIQGVYAWSEITEPPPLPPIGG